MKKLVLCLYALVLFFVSTVSFSFAEETCLETKKNKVTVYEIQIPVFSLCQYVLCFPITALSISRIFIIESLDIMIDMDGAISDLRLVFHLSQINQITKIAVANFHISVAPSLPCHKYQVRIAERTQ